MSIFPMAYFISFRCYGTWFHGDDRGSSDRRFFNVFGEPYIPPDPRLVQSEMHQSKQPPFELGLGQRAIVRKAIFEVCAFRGYGLIALNVRTNHVHVVVAGETGPEKMMEAFKAYATRRMKERGVLQEGIRPWSRHGSTRYLWTEKSVKAAALYVLYGQGVIL
jgi:REP element-mobilizing transposase RayT